MKSLLFAFMLLMASVSLFGQSYHDEPKKGDNTIVIYSTLSVDSAFKMIQQSLAASYSFQSISDAGHSITTAPRAIATGVTYVATFTVFKQGDQTVIRAQATLTAFSLYGPLVTTVEYRIMKTDRRRQAFDQLTEAMRQIGAIQFGKL